MIKEAINACVALNQWNLAVDLANKNAIKEIDVLLAKYVVALIPWFALFLLRSKLRCALRRSSISTDSFVWDAAHLVLRYAAHLLEKSRKFDAIDLYRKAAHHLDAAKLLHGLAAEAGKANKPTRAKQLYVLGALQIEEYREKARGTNADPTRSALDGLLAEDANDQTKTRMIESAWHGAEAYHFFLLAQRQLYNGEYAASLATASALADYDDVLEPAQAYSVMALGGLLVSTTLPFLLSEPIYC